MEYRFIEGVGKSDSNTIYIELENEISRDNLILKLIAIGKTERDKKIRLNLDRIYNKKLKQFIIDFITIHTYNYKKRDLIKNTRMPGRSTIGSVINECRYIIDSPPNIMNINTITDYIRVNTPENIDISILDEDTLKKLDMNLLVGMNSGSRYPASMIVLTYKTADIDPVVLVGKGVIFDSGGLNLKHGDFSSMKYDKTGAIYVWGLIKALALENTSGHFVGLLPFIENMPGSNALHPGDILKGCNGRTVEVTNTDAEGRVILADALCWANKNIHRPRLTIDIATLTGQAMSIYGSLGTAVMCNKSGDEYVRQIVRLGDNNGEYFWQLPLHRVYKKYLDSDVANYRNFSPEISASTIMAGMFLAEFAPKKTPWIHLDIAGIAYRNNATGEPMLTLYYFLSEL
jgi:leucyl aminopeptidase